MKFLVILGFCGACVLTEEALSRHKRGWGYETTTQFPGGWALRPVKTPQWDERIYQRPTETPVRQRWGWGQPTPPTTGWGQQNFRLNGNRLSETNNDRRFQNMGHRVGVGGRRYVSDSNEVVQGGYQGQSRAFNVIRGSSDGSSEGVSQDFNIVWGGNTRSGSTVRGYNSGTWSERTNSRGYGNTGSRGVMLDSNEVIEGGNGRIYYSSGEGSGVRVGSSEELGGGTNGRVYVSSRGSSESETGSRKATKSSSRVILVRDNF